ncbi:MAG: hypothetical protein WC307_03140 [Candidatus Nanoarchaeia archaeon]
MNEQLLKQIKELHLLESKYKDKRIQELIIHRLEDLRDESYFLSIR